MFVTSIPLIVTCHQWGGWSLKLAVEPWLVVKVEAIKRERCLECELDMISVLCNVVKKARGCRGPKFSVPSIATHH